jgi:hypothetical protein
MPDTARTLYYLCALCGSISESGITRTHGRTDLGLCPSTWRLLPGNWNLAAKPRFGASLYLALLAGKLISEFAGKHRRKLTRKLISQRLPLLTSDLASSLRASLVSRLNASLLASLGSKLHPKLASKLS